ncbi:hypothetical protein CVT24_007286 [Panaeolus cyanescens]|uniref:Uncharacterized protein n=1 Tax=Panaeolus cyanescens TaxID=181874 RepID=A0A409VJ38_9AGAR|nr:hypothetical protein CVT24_007286 [Panaeolus cyanescens]
MFRFNPSSLLHLRSTLVRRNYSTGVHKRPTAEPDDFRPPWVYFGTRLISMVIIPGIGLYSVFLYDFGDREHVFQPSSFNQMASSQSQQISKMEQDIMALFTKLKQLLTEGTSHTEEESPTVENMKNSADSLSTVDEVFNISQAVDDLRSTWETKVSRPSTIAKDLNTLAAEQQCTIEHIQKLRIQSRSRTQWLNNQQSE